MAVLRQTFKDLAENFVDDIFNDFTHAYTIEALTETTDNQGGYTDSWATHASIVGFVFPLSEDQKVIDESLRSENAKCFKFEYVAGIEQSMRILHDSEYYNVHSIKSIADKDVWIEIIAYKDQAT
jgi:head-tail adaptor